MDAAFDYCRQIVDDMEFNKRQFKSKLGVIEGGSFEGDRLSGEVLPGGNERRLTEP
jgi:hypothetical protein